jgi:hypothetical protein
MRLPAIDLQREALDLVVLALVVLTAPLVLLAFVGFFIFHRARRLPLLFRRG